MNETLFFVGVTRFSLYIPGSASWNTSRNAASEAEYRERLFSAERLDPRLDIFLNLSLPQIARAAERHKIAHVVQYSSLLPQKYKSALEEAAKTYDFLHLYCNDSAAQHDQVIERTAAELAFSSEQDTVTFAWYRLDDDDLLSSEFFDLAKPYIIPQHAGYVVSLGRGYSAFYNRGKLWNLRELYRPKTSVGQLYVSSLKKSEGVFIQPPRQNHALIDKWAPTIIDSRRPAFLTMLHADQDGHARGDGETAVGEILKEQETLPYLEENRVFWKSFAEVDRSAFGEQTVLIDSRGVSQDAPLAVTQNPVAFTLHDHGSMVAIDYQFSAALVDKEARVFIAIDFDEHISSELHWPWQKFSPKTAVSGKLLTPFTQGRVTLSIPSGLTPASILVWHSKNQGFPVYCEYLSYRMV